MMERSGHLSTAGVRSYERTTAIQQKQFPILCQQLHQVEECSLLYNQQARHQRSKVWKPQEKGIKLEKCLTISTFMVVPLILNVSYRFGVILMLLF